MRLRSEVSSPKVLGRIRTANQTQPHLILSLCRPQKSGFKSAWLYDLLTPPAIFYTPFSKLCTERIPNFFWFLQHTIRSLSFFLSLSSPSVFAFNPSLSGSHFRASAKIPLHRGIYLLTAPLHPQKLLDGPTRCPQRYLACPYVSVDHTA